MFLSLHPVHQIPLGSPAACIRAPSADQSRRGPGFHASACSAASVVVGHQRDASNRHRPALPSLQPRSSHPASSGPCGPGHISARGPALSCLLSAWNGHPPSLALSTPSNPTHLEAKGGPCPADSVGHRCSINHSPSAVRCASPTDRRSRTGWASLVRSAQGAVLLSQPPSVLGKCGENHFIKGSLGFVFSTNSCPVPQVGSGT